MIRCLMFIAAVALACSAGDPIPVAVKYEYARIAGDLLVAKAMITRTDSAAWAAPAGRNISPRNFGLEEGGLPGARFDSARRASGSSGDTVFVDTFMTVPNWEAVGGQHKWNGSSYVDQAKTEPTIMANLPRITQQGGVVLVRDGRRWGVSLGIARAAQLQPHWLAAMSTDSSYAARAAAARKYLSLAKTPGLPKDEVSASDSMLRDLIALQPIADSLQFSSTLEPTTRGMEFLGRHQVRSQIRNHSSVGIYLVQLQVTFTGKETKEIYVFNVPPHGRKESFDYGAWDGQIARVHLQSVQLEK